MFINIPIFILYMIKRRKDLMDVFGSYGISIRDAEDEEGEFDEFDIPSTEGLSLSQEVELPEHLEKILTHKRIEPENDQGYTNPLIRIVFRDEKGRVYQPNKLDKRKIKSAVQMHLSSIIRKNLLTPLIVSFAGNELFIYADRQLDSVAQNMPPELVLHPRKPKTDIRLRMEFIPPNYMHSEFAPYTKANLRVKSRLHKMTKEISEEKKKTRRLSNRLKKCKGLLKEKNEKVTNLEARVSELSAQLRSKNGLLENTASNPEACAKRPMYVTDPDSLLPICVKSDSELAKISYEQVLKITNLRGGLSINTYYDMIFAQKDKKQRISRDTFRNLIFRGIPPQSNAQKNLVMQVLQIPKESEPLFYANDKYGKPTILYNSTKTPVTIKPTNFNIYFYELLEKNFGKSDNRRYYAQKFSPLSDMSEATIYDLFHGKIPKKNKEKLLNGIRQLGGDAERAEILIDLDNPIQRKRAFTFRDTSLPKYLSLTEESVKAYLLLARIYGDYKSLSEYANKYGDHRQIDKVEIYRLLRDGTPLPQKDAQILLKDMKPK